MDNKQTNRNDSGLRGPLGVFTLIVLILIVIWKGIAWITPSQTVAKHTKNHTTKSDSQKKSNLGKSENTLERTLIHTQEKNDALILELWDESSVNKITKGSITLRQGGLKNGPILYESAVNPSGLTQFNVSPGQYKIEVSAPGFFDSTSTYIEAPLNSKKKSGQVFRLEMIPALIIYGSAITNSGRRKDSGFIQLKNIEKGDIIYCDVSKTGLFTSPSIPGGSYAACWVKEKGTPTLATQSMTVAGRPGEKIELEIAVN